MSHMCRILVVDDDPRMCDSLEILLSEEGYEVQTRHNGREALKSLSKEDFDLVLLDLSLPDISGVEIMDHICRQAPDTPVIVITGYASLDSAVEALKKGVFDYIPKPFENDKLSKTVENALCVKAAKIERERAQEDLRDSERRFKDIAYSMADWIWEVDEKGFYTYCSKRVEDILGYSPDEVIGKTPFDFMPQEEAHHIREVFNAIASENEPIVELENWNLTKEGQKVCLLTNGVPMLDQSGQLVGYRGVDKDITERKRAEEALRASEKKHRTFLEASPDPVVAYDVEGKVVYLNPAFTDVFGWSLKELLGRKTDYVPEENWPETEAMIEKVLAGKSVSGVRSRRYTKTGAIVDVSISIATYLDTDGNPAGSIHILRDITEREQLEAQLRQAQKLEAIGTLAGGIAHDFNNLLMAIQGNISLMLMEFESTHPHYTRLKTIESQVRSGAQLTSHLLGYARKGRYEARPLDLNRLVEEASETFGRARKNIAINRELSEDLWTIEADRGQVEQILLNLFVNAGDAMPEGGQLTLRTMNITHHDMRGKLYQPKHGEYVLLTVADTGMGMDKKTQSRIFDPFFTTKEMGRGTGLGLASAYGIVKGHGGYIDVDSRRGEGTTFSIYLPASDKSVGQVARPHELVAEGKETVLLVDDEEAIRQVAQELLEATGYKVLVARDGREAVELYEKKQDEIDIVLLDIVMPNMDGGETYDMLKGLNPEVKVLLFSGYTVNGQATEILARGCNGFIQKPFNAKELSSKLREILDKQ